jgi:hypothetical protein
MAFLGPGTGKNVPVEVVVMSMRLASFPAFIRGKLRINGQLNFPPKKGGAKNLGTGNAIFNDFMYMSGCRPGDRQIMVHLALVIGWYCYKKKNTWF